MICQGIVREPSSGGCIRSREVSMKPYCGRSVRLSHPDILPKLSDGANRNGLFFCASFYLFTYIGPVTSFVAIRYFVLRQPGRSSAFFLRMNPIVIGEHLKADTNSESMGQPPGLRHAIPELFRHSEMGVLIADAVTYEVIWANDSLCGMVGSSIAGKKCYELLHGRTQRCPQCELEPLIEHAGEVYISREGYSEILGRKFRVYDSMIEWEPGRRVRVEYLVDYGESVGADRDGDYPGFPENAPAVDSAMASPLA